MGPFGMQLEMTITLGNVIQTSILLGAILGAYLKLRDHVVELRVKVDSMWGEYERRRRAR